jgi:hypothetical protein
MPSRQTLTRAEREASGWIVRIKAHDASDADRRDFQAWLEADPDHPKAYAKLERTWGAVQALQHLKGRAAANDSAPARRSWTVPAFAIAACALLAHWRRRLVHPSAIPFRAFRTLRHRPRRGPHYPSSRRLHHHAERRRRSLDCRSATANAASTSPAATPSSTSHTIRNDHSWCTPQRATSRCLGPPSWSACQRRRGTHHRLAGLCVRRR